MRWMGGARRQRQGDIPTAIVLSIWELHGKVPGSGSAGETTSLPGLNGKMSGPAENETILTEGWLYRVSITPSPFCEEVWVRCGWDGKCGAVATRRGGAGGR